MKRRLYFLLPDVTHTRALADELEAEGIPRRQIHVVAGQNVDLEGLPTDPEDPGNDPDARLESVFWNGNLAVFFVALIGLFVLALLQVSAFWLLVPVAVMLVSLISGALFASHVPNVHLSEFSDALHHQEILLMVDVPRGDVSRIEEFVHRRHPEAVPGGAGWHIDALPV